ncbi:hypothetical protein ASPBRDRAFT_43244 [Aspergillus brasiliensis CBS 101740]|uniref:Uncharacterized protein n=1 Tax=Aspergillus brasiliensis (strain CBS 101740 / IMI 381727 / IBT 21946) TaxID=767769 RepID=A0A1L9UJL5_ASPBC|nr:hypothetical protein ASPBRDRAFT_43244 [Aspergillus brasiliensis CBS 101740]
MRECEVLSYSGRCRSACEPSSSRSAQCLSVLSVPPLPSLPLPAQLSKFPPFPTPTPTPTSPHPTPSICLPSHVH